jgi:hypothetical protein
VSGGFRRFFRKNDASSAYGREAAAMKKALDAPVVAKSFSAEMTRREANGEGALLGHTLETPVTPVRLATSDLIGKTHALILGATGAGKTALARLLVSHVLELRRYEASAPVPCIVGYNGDLPQRARELADTADIEALYFDPFHPAHLLPFQILKRDPSVPPEVQAFEVTTLFERATDAALGCKQDEFTDLLFLLGIEGGLHLPAVAELTFDPIRLTAEAARSPNATVRRYFAGKTRISEASLQGVRARFHRLLRLPTTRKMLEAESCASFRQLLASVPLIVDFSKVPLGAEDIGRFWAGLFTTKLTRAVFEREPSDGPAIVFADEWQEGLLAGAGVAEAFERLLSVARGRLVSFVLISQSLAGAAKVSAALPKMVATNTDVQFLGACSPDDARLLRLPITGRRRREAPAPWETGPRSPFLSPSEELELLVRETANMPKRTFWFFHRGAHPAVRFRSAELAPRQNNFERTSVPTGLRHR